MCRARRPSMTGRLSLQMRKKPYVWSNVRHLWIHRQSVAQDRLMTRCKANWRLPWRNLKWQRVPLTQSWTALSDTAVTCTWLRLRCRNVQEPTCETIFIRYSAKLNKGPKGNNWGSKGISCRCGRCSKQDILSMCPRTIRYPKRGIELSQAWVRVNVGNGTTIGIRNWCNKNMNSYIRNLALYAALVSQFLVFFQY